MTEACRLKIKIFQKWRTFCNADFCGNRDRFNNEYYLVNGIYVIKITEDAKYKFGLHTVQRRQEEGVKFDNGYYVMSTRHPNFYIIDDPDILHFIFHFDLTQKKSLHKELRRRLKVDLNPKGVPGNYSYDQSYHDIKAIAS